MKENILNKPAPAPPAREWRNANFAVGMLMGRGERRCAWYSENEVDKMLEVYTAMLHEQLAQLIKADETRARDISRLAIERDQAQQRIIELENIIRATK